MSGLIVLMHRNAHFGAECEELLSQRFLGSQISERMLWQRALHVYYLQRKYPHAEMSLSCPRLRPIINNDKISPLDVGEKQLCQIICAYRIFLPFVGITVSSRESARSAMAL